MRLLTVIFFLLFSNSLFGQTTKQVLVDSLLKELSKAKEDTNKVKLLNDLVYPYAFLDPDKALKYSNDELALAEHLKWQKGIELAYNRIGICYGRKSEYSVGLEYLQKSLKLSESMNDYSERFKNLNDISTIYSPQKRYQDALEYRLSALKLSEVKDVKQDQANELYWIGNDYVNQQNYPKAQEYWLRSLKIKEEIGDKKREDLLNNIALIYLIQNDTALTLEYYNKALKLGEDVGDKKMKSEAYLHIGNVYSTIGDYSKSLDFFRQARDIKDALGDRYGVSLVLNNISGVYTSMGDYPNAIKYSLESLQIAKEIDNKTLIAADMNDISIAYQKLPDYPKALESLFNSLKLFEDLGRKDLIPSVLGNIGVIYSSQGNYSEATKYLQNSLKLKEEIGNKDDISSALNDLGELYYNQHNYAMALSSVFKAIAVNKQSDNKLLILIDLKSIGKYYLKIAEDGANPSLPDSLAKFSRQTLLRKSINYLGKSIDIAKEIRSLDNLQEGYQLLSEAQSLEGNFQQALESHKQFSIYHDSVFNNEKSKEIARKEIQFDFDNKLTLENAKSEKQKALLAESYKDSLRLFGISGGAVVIIILIIFYFYRKREKDRFNLQILEVKREALNAQMSDHFISNVMDSINSFIENNEKGKASEYLLMFNKLIRKVLENSSKKYVSLTEELEISRIYIELEKLRFTEGSLYYDIVIEKAVDPDNTQIPPMIFQVLIENALKHGFKKTEGGRLKINVEMKNGRIACTVVDNGIGRKASMQNKSFDRVSHGSSLAEKLLDGIGTNNRESFVVTDLINESNSPIGTKVAFTLPYISN